MLLSRQYVIKLVCLLAVFILLTGCSSSGSSVDFQSMLQNLSRSYPNIWKLLTATAYVMGFFFAFKGVYALKAYGESRTMMSSSANIKGPIAYLFAATMLIFSPAAFHMINFTFFGTSNILSYTGGGVGSISQTSIDSVIGVVQIIGLIAFIRGWVYVARSGEQSGGQQGSGKALTHIIGGALAINVVQLKDVIWNTFGFS